MKKKKKEYDFCEICEKEGHMTKDCWLNPRNKRSKYQKSYLRDMEDKNINKKVKRKVEANLSVIQKSNDDWDYENQFADDNRKEGDVNNSTSEETEDNMETIFDNALFQDYNSD